MTNQLLTLEYVCTGNNGRSPMAEAIAQDYVQRQGLADKIKVSSSGSGLHRGTMKFGDALVAQKLGLVRMALENGVFQESWKQREARLVSEDVRDEQFLDDLFNYAIRVEGILRDQALFEVGLVATGKYHQTTQAMILDADRRIVLPMAGSNVDQVKKIYTGFNQPRVLTTLNEYAGMEGDVPNPFCQLLPAYRESRDHLMVAVPKTVDRAVRELLG